MNVADDSSAFEEADWGLLVVQKSEPVFAAACECILSRLHI